MQNTGARNPTVEDRAQAVPSRPSLLAAAAQSLPPQSAETVPESAQRRKVPRYGVITVVAFDHPFQPCSDDADGLMHLTAQLLLDSQQRYPHPLDRSRASDEVIAFRALPTVVSKP